jgi:hypothetical protein
MTVAMADVLENWLGSNEHTGVEALTVVKLEGNGEPGDDAEAEQAGLPGLETA